MASPNSTFTDMVTATLREHPNTVSDNVSANNALYTMLKKKGKIRKIDGGTEIVRPLDYAANTSFQRYSGYDTLSIAASDVLSAAKYNWVQSAIHVTASGFELRQNSGKNQLIDLAKSRLTNAMRTAANYMSLDMYSSGALTNQMTGLSGMIGTAGAGTVGGIDAATYTFWANQYREMAGTGAWTKSTIKGDMNAIYMACVRGTDSPDLIVSTHDFFAVFWESLQDLQRFATSDQATAGFQSLKFLNADVIFDSNTNFATTGERMYFLNTDYLELVVHRDANWTALDKKMSVNQDAEVIPIIWQGQLTCSNRSLQGILIDAA
jgi:hypothetical protein